MKSILARKITLRFLLVELALFVLVLVIFFSALLPAFVTSTTNKCDYIATTIVNQFDNQFKNLSNYSYMISQSNDIMGALGRLLNNPVNASSRAARLNLLLNDYSSHNSFCRRITIDDMNGSLYSSITNVYETDAHVFEEAGYQDMLQTGKSSWFSPVYTQEKSTGATAYSIAFSRKTSVNGHPYILTLFADVTDVFAYMESTASTFFDDLALYDIYGNLLYHSGNTSIFSSRSQIEDIYHYTGNDDSDDYYASAYGRNNLCAIIGYTSRSTLYGDFMPYFTTVIISFTLIFLSTLIILLPTISKSLAPLYSLSTSMKAIVKGDANTRSSVTSKDEIGELGQIYNTMLDTIEDNTKVLLEKEQEKNRLRFSLVVSQIDPHFILNTMNIITSLARHNKNADIMELNTALIKLLQDRLRISDTEVLDSVAQEIEITKEYLKITQYRTQMDVQFHWDYPEDMLSLQMPKNVLQPLIENSLTHGLYHVDTGSIEGEIRIVFERDGEGIVITVTDNGSGFSEESMRAFYAPEPPGSEAERGKHIGLRNIKDRLSYLYPGLDDVMTLGNVHPHGARITLRIRMEGTDGRQSTLP